MRQVLIIIFIIYLIYRINSIIRRKKEEAGEEAEEVKDPWQTLGISRDSVIEEIKEAYRRKCAEYHPDKVEHLGERLKEVALEEFKKIQQAYELISREKGIK